MFLRGRGFLPIFRLYSTSVSKPKIKIQWFYATDSPISKPEYLNYKQEKQPEKFLPFSDYDSSRLEKRYQELKTDKSASSIIEVNEDKLFQVDLDSMALTSVYWLSPTYEVRRGTWFSSDGMPLDTRISNELEAKYEQLKPWEFKHNEMRKKTISKEIVSQFIGLAQKGYPRELAVEMARESKELESKEDAFKGVAEISNDEKVLFSNGVYASIFPKEVDEPFELSVIRNLAESSAPLPQVRKIRRGYTKELLTSFFDSFTQTPLPGLSDIFKSELNSVDQKSEEENVIDSKSNDKMQSVLESDYKLEVDEHSSKRKIKHLILCIHGIGQILGTKYETIDFPHSCNVMRNTMKKVFNSNENFKQLSEDPEQNTIQVLPVTWRHQIEFDPLKNFKNDKQGSQNDHLQTLPSVSQLNVDGIKPIRDIVGEVLLDILLYYEPHYKNQILNCVSRELNRIYELYKERNPDFDGKVHILGHSLGSSIAFDTMSAQSSKTPKERKLDFEVDSLFCIGSPTGVFQLLRRKNIVSRDALPKDFDPEVESNFSSPLVANLYNVFHPSDPVAYRMEPLVSPKFANFQPESVPFAIKGISTQIKDLGEEIQKLQKNLFSKKNVMVESAKKKVQSSPLQEHALSEILAGLVSSDEYAEAYEVDMREKDLSILNTFNRSGRIDYCLQQGVFDFSLVSAVSAHVSYFEDEDTAGFIMREILNSDKETPDRKRVAVYKKK